MLTAHDLFAIIRAINSLLLGKLYRTQNTEVEI